MPMTIELWSEMINDLLPTDAVNLKGKALTWAAKFKIARDLAQSAGFKLKTHEAHRSFHEGFYIHTQALDERQTQVLVQILEDFVRAGDQRRLYSLQGASKAAEKLTLNVEETYKVIVFSLFQSIGDKEDFFSHIREGRRFGKHLWKELGELHDRFKNDFPKVVQRYEAMLQQTYPYFPPAHQAILREFVELFVFEPYDLGITYIHRNYPGAIGAFHGLGGP